MKAKDTVIDEATKAGKQEGIREVVIEWVHYCPKCGCYLPKRLDGLRAYLICRNCGWDGETKLKEWGIKE